MAFSGAGEAVDKLPCSRQCDGQQHPSPQPRKQKYPHTQPPFTFGKSAPAAQVHLRGF